MKSETHRLAILPGRDTTIKVNVPDQRDYHAGVVLAHGMANDLNLPLLERTAQRLAECGFAVVRFNFLYREAGSERVDSGNLLLSTLNRICGYTLDAFNLTSDRLVIGGKSLGARISAWGAGQGLESGALIYLGFPLQPPGHPEKSRDDLILAITDRPQFFIAGERDHLCPIEHLKHLVGRLESPYNLHIIPQGDHSFVRPGDSGHDTAEDVQEEISSVVCGWLQEYFHS